MKLTIKTVTIAAVIAALYATLTLVLAPISFGPLQCRVSESLTVLAAATPIAIPGLTVGCVIANLMGLAANPAGAWDVLFGSAATLIAAISSYLLRRYQIKGLPLLSALMPVVFNAVIIGTEMWLVIPGDGSLASALVLALQIGLGELIACFGLGLPLYLAVRRTKILDRV